MNTKKHKFICQNDDCGKVYYSCWTKGLCPTCTRKKNDIRKKRDAKSPALPYSVGFNNGSQSENWDDVTDDRIYPVYLSGPLGINAYNDLKIRMYSRDYRLHPHKYR